MNNDGLRLPPHLTERLLGFHIISAQTNTQQDKQWTRHFFQVGEMKEDLHQFKNPSLSSETKRTNKPQMTSLQTGNSKTNVL